MNAQAWRERRKGWRTAMKFSLQTKLMGLVGIMLVLLLVVGGVGLFSTGRLNDHTRNVADERLPAMMSLDAISQDMLNVRVQVLTHIVVNNANQQAQIDNEIRNLERNIEDEFGAWAAEDADGSDAETRAEIKAAWDDYKQQYQSKTLPASRAGNDDSAQALANGIVGDAFKTLLESINSAEASFHAEADQERAAASSAFANARLLILGVSGLALLLGVWLGLALTRPIVRGTRAVAAAANNLVRNDFTQLQAAFERMAQGDLTAELQAKTHPVLRRKNDRIPSDEIGTLANAFNYMIESFASVAESFNRTNRELNVLVGEVRENAEAVASSGAEAVEMTSQISTATQEIAGAIQDVALGTNRQAQQVNAASNSFDQMAMTIEAVARGAQEQGKSLQRAVELTQSIAERNDEAAQAAKEALEFARVNADRAEAGNQTVQRTVQAMVTVRGSVVQAADKVSEMGERSKQIDKIVKTIEDLTEQTNLLALNAAIEAARAGEAGKGFAVVAEEVRKLAERASASTQEIAALIQGMQQTVGEAVSAMTEGAQGVEAVTAEAEGVREALDGILTSAAQVSERNRQIVEATEATVGRSRELQSRMEDTSAIAEENSAAATEMSATAREVRQAVQSVSAVTEQNAAAAEEVSAATEEAATQLEAVNATAQSLNEIASSLRQFVSRFTLDDARHAAPPERGLPELAIVANGADGADGADGVGSRRAAITPLVPAANGHARAGER